MSASSFAGWPLSDAIDFATARFWREPWTLKGMEWLGEDPFIRQLNFGKLQAENLDRISPRKDAFNRLRHLLRVGRLAATGVLGGDLRSPPVLMRPDHWDILNSFDEENSSVGAQAVGSSHGNDDWFSSVRVYPILECPFRVQWLLLLHPERRNLGEILGEYVWNDPELTTVWSDQIGRQDHLEDVFPATLEELPAIWLQRDGEALFRCLVDAGVAGALSISHPRDDENALQFFDILAGRLASLGELIAGGEVRLTGVADGDVCHRPIDPLDVERGRLLLRLPMGWLYELGGSRPAFTNVRLVAPVVVTEAVEPKGGTSSERIEEDEIKLGEIALGTSANGRPVGQNWNDLIDTVIAKSLKGAYSDPIRSASDISSLIIGEIKERNLKEPLREDTKQLIDDISKKVKERYPSLYEKIKAPLTRKQPPTKPK